MTSYRFTYTLYGKPHSVQMFMLFYLSDLRPISIATAELACEIGCKSTGNINFWLSENDYANPYWRNMKIKRALAEH